MSSQMFPVFSVYYQKLKRRFSFSIDTNRLSQLPWYFWIALGMNLIPIVAGCIAASKIFFMPAEDPVGGFQFIFTLPLIIFAVSLLFVLLYFSSRRSSVAPIIALVAAVIGAVASASIAGVLLV